jgi:hypothetical protein
MIYASIKQAATLNYVGGSRVSRVGRGHRVSRFSSLSRVSGPVGLVG